MRFDTVSYDLGLEKNEQCYYHGALQQGQRPMCFGVSDRALFILRERFLRMQAYTMHRIPLSSVREVVLSRERGWRVWSKWVVVITFGVLSAVAMSIGLWLAPDVKPSVFGTGGPFLFFIIGLIMLIDSRWRLVVTIRTDEKDYRWRPHIFDKREEVRNLREGFLDACRFVDVRTHRHDLMSESEAIAFWRWFVSHEKGGIDLTRVRNKIHRLCDRIDVELEDAPEGSRTLIITANYARDAYPVVQDLVAMAPAIDGLTIRAFKPRRRIGDTYRFKGVEYPLDRIFFNSYTDGFDLAIEICADWEQIDDHEDLIWDLYRDLLGEYDAFASVRYVHLRELNEIEDTSYLLPISQLPECVDEFHVFEAD